MKRIVILLCCILLTQFIKADEQPNNLSLIITTETLRIDFLNNNTKIGYGYLKKIFDDKSFHINISTTSNALLDGVYKTRYSSSSIDNVNLEIPIANNIINGIVNISFTKDGGLANGRIPFTFNRSTTSNALLDRVYKTRYSNISIDIDNVNLEIPIANNIINGIVNISFTKDGGLANGVIPYTNGFINGKVKVFVNEDILVYEADVIDNKREGSEKHYSKDGMLSEEIPYKNGLIEGIWKLYSSLTGTGKLILETSYVNGQEDGIYRCYSAISGKQQSEGVRKNGTINGFYRAFYDNGTTWKNENYKNGRKDGRCIEYYQNGNPEICETYTNGYMLGDYYSYYESGNVRAKYLRVKGTKTVEEYKVEEYYDSGNVKFKYSIVNKKIEGLEYFYADSCSAPQKIDTYKNGQLINRKMYDVLGKLEFEQDYPYSEGKY